MTERGWLYPGNHLQRGGPALVAAESGAEVSYPELDARATRISRALRRLGVGVEDHVCLWVENSVDYPVLWWGAHYAGAYYTPMSTRLTAGEAAHIVTDSGAKVLIVSPGIADRSLDELLPQVSGVVPVVAGGSHPRAESLDSLVATESSAPVDGAVDGAVMLYSSGTTGVPKAVKRSIGRVPLGSAPGVAPIAQALFGLGPGSVYLSPAPLYHAAPFGFVTAATALGATAVVMERFGAEELMASIERFGVTHLQLVPTMFIRLLDLPNAVKEKYDLSSLTCAIHAAAPCPVEVKERMFEWWGPIIHEYYSGTEAAGFTYCSPQDWLTHRGSVGRPVIGQVHIVDEQGKEQPVGETGAIYFGHGTQFEYHNDPDKTAEVHLNDWATMGDVGRIDEDGFLYLTDRQSHMIISGGVNVYPQESENLLATHPAVFDVAVIGVPNRDFGEEVKAIVQPSPGFEPDDTLAAELIAFCRSHLSDIKCPRSVDFRPELPRDDTGKMFKRLLRAEYWTT